MKYNSEMKFFQFRHFLVMLAFMRSLYETRDLLKFFSNISCFCQWASRTRKASKKTATLEASWEFSEIIFLSMMIVDGEQRKREYERIFVDGV